MLLLLLCVVGRCCADNLTTTPVTQDSTASTIVEDNKPVPSSEKTLVPIYKMAEIFLEVVITSGRLADLNLTENLSTFDAVIQSARDHWLTWLKHYWSYLVCIVLAVVYMLVFPVVGCVICGCRSAGKCFGGSQTKRKTKSWHWYRRLCSFLLLLLSVGLLFGVISMFLANKMVYERTRADGEGVPRAIAQGLENFGVYLDKVKDWFMAGGRGELKHQLDGIKTTLDQFPADVRDQVGQMTGIAPFFSAIDDLLGSLEDAIMAANSSADEMVTTEMTELTSKLSEIRTNVTAGCNTTQCQSIQNITASLETVANFTSLPRLADVITALESTKVADNLKLSRTSYDEIQSSIDNNSKSTRTTLVAEHDVILANFTSFLNETLANMDDLSLDHVASYVSDTLSPTIDQYGRYFYYVGLTLSTMMLFIDLLYFLGLLYGACGSLEGDSTECCRKSKAEHVLKVALGSMFAFSWIIMLAVGVLFPVGGIVHNDLCRNLLLPAPDPPSAQVLDTMLSNSMNLSWSVLSLYEHCDRNEALYEAFARNTENERVNLTRVLSTDSYQLLENVNKLKSGQYLNNTLDVIVTALEDNLKQLNNSVATLGLDQYREQLNKPLISGNLTELQNELEKAGYKELLEGVVVVKSEVYTRTVNAVTLLNTSIVKLEELATKLNSTMVLLEVAQRHVTAQNTSEAATEMSKRLLDKYQSTFDDVTNLVTTDLARCGSVAKDISQTKDSICQQLLQPYNAFWFSAAWCLIFFIILVPNVIVLINWFWPGRRSIDYRSSYLDDPSQIDHRQTLDYDHQGNQPRSKARIPYEHLPVISGARASPVTGARHHHPYQQQQQPAGRQYHPHQDQVVGDWDWQPDDVSRDVSRHRDSPMSQQRQWTNLAYDDSYDRRPADVDDLGWRRQAREQHRRRYDGGYHNGNRRDKYDDYRANERARRYDDNPIW